MRTTQWMGFAAAALCAAGANAATLPKNGEASLLVTGTIEVAADGSVLAHTIDHANQLDAGVADVIDASMRDWHFKPMHGSASSAMRLVLHARKNEQGKYVLWIASASFPAPAGTNTSASSWSYGTHEPPAYPQEALRSGVNGKVYLALHLDRDGKVIDALVEQVNLGVNDTPRHLEHWRDVLGTASVDAARNWRFQPPESPADARPDPSVDPEAAATIRVPVEFRLDSQGTSSRYGRWEMYVPGPRRPIPWLSGLAGADAAMSPDAFAANGIYPVGGRADGLQLETHLAN